MILWARFASIPPACIWQFTVLSYWNLQNRTMSTIWQALALAANLHLCILTIFCYYTLLNPNTDGWGKKLVTIFASLSWLFYLETLLSFICQFQEFGSGKILPLWQLFLSPGFAKIAPYPSCHRDSLLSKEPGQVDGWLRRVTFPPPTTGPLRLSDDDLPERKDFIT